VVYVQLSVLLNRKSNYVREQKAVNVKLHKRIVPYWS